ncbi:hypothetical protein CEXT_384091 [Caerostris extrusa]|uniref:Uncharacterized protein n=1 Tax=Caerostris extrusa TaxID=172846 RepID=A0AAV4MF44_CAEEX|nr:hypothetical protein CEXT_384091 [Caerostris extrusa]
MRRLAKSQGVLAQWGSATARTLPPRATRKRATGTNSTASPSVAMAGLLKRSCSGSPPPKKGRGRSWQTTSAEKHIKGSSASTLRGQADQEEAQDAHQELPEVSLFLLDCRLLFIMLGLCM